MIKRILRLAEAVVALVALAACVVERPGEGEAKSREALELVKELVCEIEGPEIATSPWLVALVTKESILCKLLDFVVKQANGCGDFAHTVSQ